MGPRPEPPSVAVLEFVSAEPLPLLQRVERVFLMGEVEGFRATYGHPMDCPAGCAYSVAIGLRCGSEVGWLAFEDGEGLAPDSTRFFDVMPSDSALSDERIFDRLRPGPGWRELWLWEEYLRVLARDSDSDPRALLRVAQELRSYISIEVASYLLGNSVVQGSRPILEVLAELPALGWQDPYRGIRAQARVLLAALGAPRARPRPALAADERGR